MDEPERVVQIAELHVRIEFLRSEIERVTEETLATLGDPRSAWERMRRDGWL